MKRNETHDCIYARTDSQRNTRQTNTTIFHTNDHTKHETTHYTNEQTTTQPSPRPTQRFVFSFFLEPCPFPFPSPCPFLLFSYCILSLFAVSPLYFLIWRKRIGSKHEIMIGKGWTSHDQFCTHHTTQNHFFPYLLFSDQILYLVILIKWNKG